MRAPRLAGAAFLLAGMVAVPLASGQEAPGKALLEQRTLDQANRLERAGRPDEAMNALESLLERDPGSVSALLLLFQISARAGDPERVLARVEEAVAAEGSEMPALRQLWVRTLGSAGFPDSARRVARRWIAEAPREVAAWSELSTLEVNQGDPEAAVRVLTEGRERIGSNRVFVQDLAALQSDLGDYAAAAREWKKMLSWGPPGDEAVERRLLALGPDRGPALAALQDEMSGGRVSELEAAGAVRLALSLGEFEWARALVGSRVRDLPEPAGTEVLRDYVRRAADAADFEGAAWAAAELAERSRRISDAQYWLGTSAAYAVEAGEATAARAAFERLRGSVEPGSEMHELALRRLHELTVDESPQEAQELLEAYQSLYADRKGDLVRMRVRSAEAWLDRGELALAGAVLGPAMPTDPVEAAFEAGTRGRLEILEGQPESARVALELAASVPSGRTNVRIEAMRRLEMLSGTDAEGVRSAARVLAEARESGDYSVLAVTTRRWAVAELKGGDLLAAFVAREAESSGEQEAAAAVRREIVAGWPESASAPLALLDLARSAQGREPGAAREWLERLIVGYPESALAPVARRLLDQVESQEAGA